jgi:O-6-methylguanine DNA methyltransferase
MRCKEIRNLLDAYRTGELNPADVLSVSRHLAECGVCPEELKFIERLSALIPVPRAAAPAGLLTRVLDETADCFGEVGTEIGNALIAFNRRGITMVYLGKMEPSEFEKYYEQRRGRHAHPAAVPEGYARVVCQAAAGQQPDRLPVDLEGLAPFERDVLRLLTKIPRGQVRPYRWLAREAGRPKAVRAVGNTMARNPIPLLLPCHRVVPSQGGVGNYAFGSHVKRELLLREGVPMDELDELARRRVRFLGCKSTGIYCFPTCRDARRMLPSNRVPLADEAEAGRAGFRPCLHCRPETLAS